MNSEEQRIYDEAFDLLKAQYPNVVITHPYRDEYMEFYVNGKKIGGFNPKGYNFLYCMNELTKAYEFMLY